MSFLELAKKRQSVRGYLDKPVAREDIETCLEAARLSPSACNSQPWKFVVVEDPAQRQKVVEAVYNPEVGINKFAQSAPVLVVVVEEHAKLMPKIADTVPWDTWSAFDDGSAVAYFCLAAADLGLGTCIMGGFNQEIIRQGLAIPEERRVKMVISLGYAENETIRSKTRKTLEEISSYNQY